jgi:hypothetical protein
MSIIFVVEGHCAAVDLPFMIVVGIEEFDVG